QSVLFEVVDRLPAGAGVRALRGAAHAAGHVEVQVGPDPPRVSEKAHRVASCSSASTYHRQLAGCPRLHVVPSNAQKRGWGYASVAVRQTGGGGVAPQY